MIKKVAAANMGKGNQPWLKTHFHFSFADYYNPKNINFGVLRVLNDDFVAAHRGFDTHPHNDMEIISTKTPTFSRSASVPGEKSKLV